MSLPTFVTATRSDTVGSWLDFASTSSLSKTISCITNANRAMVIFIATGNAYATAVSVGGQAFTRIGRATYPSFFDADVWGRLNPLTGNQTLSISMSRNNSGFVTVAQFAGTSGWTAATTAYGGGNSISTAISGLPTDCMAVSCLNKFNGINGYGAGQSLIYQASRYGCYGISTYKNLAAGGSTTFTYTAEVSDKWAHALFGLLPMSAGGSNVIWWFKKLLEKRKREKWQQLIKEPIYQI